ncbi:hypothetical protein CcCBS67573_g09974 [Chytriomyces confervae]|uniref:CEP76/DRC7 peptidase-like domain-containing protein n=1 Tax=Chytriomyces confervae TaxID=246404 RepID=A0A507DLA2_9FUNG|nr:hypothetical protein CcCBS67573_g09974 [Chytriomyces confervae]
MAAELIRETGSTLPIEYAYMGSEVSAAQIRDLHRNNISSRNFLTPELSNLKWSFRSIRLGAAKVASILSSPFEKVLFLDPDVMPLQDPTFLPIHCHNTRSRRYIRAQEPPPELLTPRHLLRFVSTIPYLADRTAFAADVSLWATSDQMLELSAGDAAEHAILLCNFLLAKGGGSIEAYVVLGSGIPEGRTAYVAMKAKSGKNANEMTLMNAVTGESYAVKDPHLPLKVVGCVFNDMNVWANIQAHDDPPRMNWNIADIKHWKPFFHRKFPKTEYKSVQLEKLVFREVSARYCQELEAAIEKTIVSNVEEWRGH